MTTRESPLLAGRGERDPLEQALERLLELGDGVVLGQQLGEAVDGGVRRERARGGAGLGALGALEEVERPDVGAVGGDLEQEVAEEEARERSVGRDGCLVTEATPAARSVGPTALDPRRGRGLSA